MMRIVSALQPRSISAAALLILAACASSRMPLHDSEIRASGDPGVIERGRYLVRGPAHCAACHGDPSFDAAGRDLEMPLSGGRQFDLGPLGTVVAPNITSDPEAGIGRRSDATIVRSLRHGVAHEGRPLVPIMPFAGLADEDLRAVISYLRSLPPVAEPTPPNDLSWLGSVALRLAPDPVAKAAPPVAVEPAPTAEYGRYLATTVANCRGCHTRRSRLTGSYVGPEFAGGMKIEEAGRRFTTPNLTPAEGTVLHGMSEGEFIARFRLRGMRPGAPPSPMPWRAYAQMTDSDLAAIYRYLKTLPAVETPG